jgi:hypothetical protein
MKFVLIAVASLDDLRCGSKVGGALRSGIGASGVGAVKETEICNLREFAMSLLGTVVSGRRFSFSGQSLRRGDGRRSSWRTRFCAREPSHLKFPSLQPLEA